MPSGYRVYTPTTVDRIRLVRRLQALGLGLDEIIEALHVFDVGDPTCDSERWRLEAVVERLDAQIAELREVRREVREVMAACDRGACVFSGSDGPARDSPDPAPWVGARAHPSASASSGTIRSRA